MEAPSLAYKVLDCTLRDGGYYNRWDFESALIAQYLQAMADARIDYIELGFRGFASKGFKGACAYTTESFLNRLALPPGPVYGVMIDAKNILSAPVPVLQAIDQLFPAASRSQVQLVRIAAHFGEVEQAEAIARALKQKGYVVGLNLMQIGHKPTALIVEKAELISRWDLVDVLYFADSLGNMDSDEVLRVVKALRQHWTGELGVHAHNNMAKALDNTLKAREAGVSWLDCTMSGMGRGAGNAQTEYLLAVLARESDRFDPAPVYELAIRYFEPLRTQYGWGSNVLYFLGAQNNVHPTYIQNLLSDTHYGTDEIVGAIKYLSRLEDSASYDPATYQASLSLNGQADCVTGSSELVGLARGQEVLILANGPGLHRYLEEIQAYIKARQPIVIAINALSVSAEYIDYYCVSHNTKMLSEQAVYQQLQKPVILPKHRFSDEEIGLFAPRVPLIDYGIAIEEGGFEVQPDHCRLPADVTAGYAFAIAAVMEAGKISLVGFDGYNGLDPRQREMNHIITLAGKTDGLSQLVALTPSSYPLEQGSIYAPV